MRYQQNDCQKDFSSGSIYTIKLLRRGELGETGKDIGQPVFIQADQPDQLVVRKEVIPTLLTGKKYLNL